MKNITEFSVKNWQFTTIVFIMALVIGLSALFTMPRGEDPEFSAPIFPIVVVYPGTTPKDMEKLIVDPIEEKISQLDDLDKITTSITDGLAIVNVKYKTTVDRDSKHQELIRELDGLRRILPQDIAKIEITKVSPSDVNILQIALVSQTASYERITNIAEDLKDRLEKIKNLKNVDFWGAPERTIRVSLDLEKIAYLNITQDQIINILKSENLNIPSGSVNMGAKKFNVQTKGEYKNLNEIQNTIIRSGISGTIYLKDIAKVDYSYDEDTHICRLNGKRAVLVTASLKTNENISSVKKIYNPVVDEFSESLPGDITLIKSFDQANNVNTRLNRLGKDFLIAIIIVLITILPIGRRASYIVMLSIPLSLSIGLVLLALFGFTINQLSIVGLVVSLALLIDDSIIVVENIERWRREGYSKVQSAILATKQISMAVLGCTLLLVVAFMPIALMPGEAGMFIRSLPMAIIFTVLASLLVSLTIIPFLSTLLLKDEVKPEGNKLLVLMNKGIHLTYSKLLTSALKYPKRTLIITLVLFAGALMFVPVLGFTLFPKSEKPQFLINIESEFGSNIYETNKVTNNVEAILSDYPIVKFYTSNVGKGNPRIYYNEAQHGESSSYAQIFVQLQDDTPPKMKTDFIDELREKFSSFSDSKVEIKDFEQGPPLAAPVEVRLYNENLDSLRNISLKVENLLNKMDGVIYVNNPLKNLKTDLKLNINRDKAGMLGVLNSDIEKAVRMALVGLDVGVVTNEHENDYILKVTVDKDKSANYSILNNIYVNNVHGSSIPVSMFANIEFEASPVQINHLDKSRFITISAHVKNGYLANNINNELEQILSNTDFMKSQNYQLAGEKENTSQSFGGFGIVVLLAITIFIGILILEFKTFKSLLIVLSVIPLGLIGAVLMLFVAGQPMSFVAIIGLIALVGIEIKNSILMVDFINQLRTQGKPLEQAIIKAGEMRFVPILLTAFTAIFGLLPLVIEFSPLYSPLALVVIGGLLTSTLLSRIVTPVMYKLLPPKIENENKS